MNFIILMISFLGMKNKEFEILKVFELRQLLIKESRSFMSFDEQLPNTGAYVYFMKSGKVLMLPNNLQDSTEGINFYNRQIYNRYLKEEKFPIVNQDPSLEEIFQEDILKLNTSIFNILNHFTVKYNLDKNDYAQIIMTLKDLRISKSLSDKESVYAILLLGEEIRKSVAGKWILLKQYGTFNPYYIPGIINQNNQILLLFPISNLFYSETKIDINNFLKMTYISQPKLLLNSPYFNSNYPSYIILD